jgi:hypothetical protein
LSSRWPEATVCDDTRHRPPQWLYQSCWDLPQPVLHLAIRTDIGRSAGSTRQPQTAGDPILVPQGPLSSVLATSGVCPFGNDMSGGTLEVCMTGAVIWCHRWPITDVTPAASRPALTVVGVSPSSQDERPTSRAARGFGCFGCRRNHRASSRLRRRGSGRISPVPQPVPSHLELRPDRQGQGRRGSPSRLPATQAAILQPRQHIGGSTAGMRGRLGLRQVI